MSTMQALAPSARQPSSFASDHHRITTAASATGRPQRHRRQPSVCASSTPVDNAVAREQPLPTLRAAPADSPDCLTKRRLDEEWLRLGLSFVEADAAWAASASASTSASHAGETSCPYLDDVWLNMGLTFTDFESVPLDEQQKQHPVAAAAPSIQFADTSSHVDHVWLNMGLVDAVHRQQEPEGVEEPSLEASARLAASLVFPEPGTVSEEEMTRKEQEKAERRPVVAEGTADCKDPSSFFENDLRPIVLFDGSCNFCSSWTTFLLDWDPLGNLRFASMQSEVGKVMLRRAGMKESDTSEIVLAAHNRSHIGVDAILQIFGRLKMPFPLISLAGKLSPAALNEAAYKFVSKNRHRFSGQPACRLFDPRFNERFVS